MTKHGHPVPVGILLAFGSVLLAATPVRAGVVDSPIPAPFTQHVFTVPGVVHLGGLRSFFSCTNLDSGAVTIGVEIFSGVGGPALNDPAATSLSVGPGGTRLFGTGPAFGLIVDSNVGGTSANGSARILSTSTKTACTAFVANDGNQPPTSAWQLTIIKGKKQKAAN